jgi:hypothetical protein
MAWFFFAQCVNHYGKWLPKRNALNQPDHSQLLQVIPFEPTVIVNQAHKLVSVLMR